MNNLKKEIYNNALFLYFTYLPHYGNDKHKTKKSILLLAMIEDLLKNNCHYGFVDSRSLGYINKFVQDILDHNPLLKYCRIDLDQYNNLGDSQYIEKYQVIKEDTFVDG